MFDELGTRMKELERLQKEPYEDDWMYVRIDGRAFSSFTADMAEPYDINMSNAMKELTKFMIHKTNAFVGYHQSDEISLGYRKNRLESQFIFNGKKQKIQSVLASMAASFFQLEIPMQWPGTRATELQKRYPHFDCRVVFLTQADFVNMMYWRALDAKRNAIQSMAQSLYSHKQLYKKNIKEQLQMIEEAGVNWEKEPEYFRLGTWFLVNRMYRDMTEEELKKIPEEHRTEFTTKKLTYEIKEKVLDLSKFDFEGKIRFFLDCDTPEKLT